MLWSIRFKNMLARGWEHYKKNLEKDHLFNFLSVINALLVRMGNTYLRT